MLVLHVDNSRERETKRESRSVGKVTQWRPEGYEFNPYILQWHVINEESEYEIIERCGSWVSNPRPRVSSLTTYQ